MMKFSMELYTLWKASLCLCYVCRFQPSGVAVSGSVVMAAFNFLDGESGSDGFPLSMISPCLQWWSCEVCRESMCVLVCISLFPPEPSGPPEIIVHALTIIMVPLATPEQRSSTCQHWCHTRFSSKRTGFNTSFKCVIWANICSSPQKGTVSVCHIEDTKLTLKLICRPREELRCVDNSSQSAKTEILIS